MGKIVGAVISSSLFCYSVSSANNLIPECMTIDLFPEKMGSLNLLPEEDLYDELLYYVSPAAPLMIVNSSYHLFNANGQLMDSGQNLTNSILCDVNNAEHRHECHYLILQGHGGFRVEWKKEDVMEEGETTVDNPNLIPIGNCSHQCGDLQQLMVFDAGGRGNGEERTPLYINNKQATAASVCMNPEMCYKVVGDAVYIVSENNKVKNTTLLVEKGNTFQGYKQFGTSCRTSRRCNGKPLLAETTRGKDITVKLSSISGMKPLTDADSPQYQAACWLIYDDLRQLRESDSNIIQRYILALLYFSLNGSDWLRNYDFLTHKDECQWKKQTYNTFWQLRILGGDGIQCNESGDVNRIVLGFNGLDGIIPQELSWLVNIGVIFLPGNSLRGSIPSELGNLVNLKHFSLGWNGLTGSFPDSIARIHSLQVIDLGANLLTGTIPEFRKNMRLLNLGANILSGTLNQLNALTSLQTFNVAANQLSGTIPRFFVTMKELFFLVLTGNQLTGSIPWQLLKLPRLEFLSLNINYLSGTIPNIVANESPLRELWLSFNQLTGEIPSQLSALQSCQLLDLRDNRLSGEIPSELNELQNLSTVTLHNNNLTGIIPFDRCQQFERLQADCDSPQKVTCLCCSSCHGLFTIHGVAALGCTSSELSIVFENFKTGDFIQFQLLNYAGELLDDHYSLLTEPPHLYSRCISTSDCFQIKVSFLSSPLDMKVFVNKDIIFQEHVKELFSNYRFGFSSDGIMQEDTCDSIDLCNLEFEANSTKRGIVNKLTGIERMEYLTDPSSLQYNALCIWLKYVNEVDDKDLKKSELLQYYALAVFYYNANGQEWNNSTFWLSDNHYCTWYGVKCDSFFTVTSISLDSNQLKGPLASMIGELRGLQKLSLSHNELSGTIPVQLSVQLTNLKEFNISHNNLKGRIPSKLNFLKNLVWLDLSHNQFTGELPVNIGQLQNLQLLDLFNNAFDGNLPDSFHNLTEMRKLSLGNNLFVGSAKKITNLLSLEWLDLGNNFFTGNLPISENQSNLQVLKLSGNGFQGSISSTIERLRLLEEVMLYDNQLTGNLPSQIGNLPNLCKLSVSYNKLKGSIPSSIGKAKNLTLLHIHRNEMHGVADYFDYDFDYMADCGNTYYYPALVECTNCSICCTIDGDCLRTDSTWPGSLIKSGKIPSWFSVFLLIIMGCGTLVAILFGFNCVIERDLVLTISHNFQEKSVNRFFLSGDLIAFSVGMVTVLLQLSIVAVFLRMSDFTEPRNDWRYSLNCPSDSLTCNNKRYITVFGWTVFGCTFFVYIVKDILEGLQIIYESIRVNFKRGIFAGFIVLVVSISTTTASILYNYSTSESNTDILKDAVILLFLIEIDEKVYEITNRAFLLWVGKQERQISSILTRHLPICRHEAVIEQDNSGEIKALGEKVIEMECAIVEQKILIGELKISNDQLKVSNDQLKASNDELKVSNDHLRMSNDQQEMSNAQLKSSNDQLKASNDLLEASNTRLKTSNDRLKTSNDQQNMSNDQLKKSNDQLKASNDQLLISNGQQKISNDQLKVSYNQLKASNDQLKASNDELKISNDLLTKELSVMKEEFECSNDLLKKELNNIKEEFENLLSAFEKFKK